MVGQLQSDETTQVQRMHLVTQTDVLPWRRQPGESSRAYHAFRVYLDLGPDRTIRETARHVGKSPGHLANLSARYAWVERCDRWEDHLEQAKREREVKAVREMADRHATLSVAIQARIIDRLSRMTDAEIDELGLAELTDIFKIVAGIEATARGMPSISASQVSQRLAGSEGGPSQPQVEVVHTIVRTRQDQSLAKAYPEGELVAV